MKKFIAGIAVSILIATPAPADEGMWLLPLLEKMNSDMIYNLGCHLTPEEIYSVNNSSIKDAVVMFGGGCTGEIISDKGLLVTNHHCGYSSIQSLSTPEHNYLEDGFWAMDRNEEMPVPGLSVKFLQSMEDITWKLEKLERRDESEFKKEKEEIIAAAEKENPGCNVEITSFYNSNVYYLVISKTYRDVRFVGAPPASCGKFGGETDNWVWPRHTCDFSMFRVYAGKDNEPADYSAENVPFTPRQSLRISLRGVKEGDFAMIMGYPARTQRFQTARQLEGMIRTNDIRIDARTIRQDIMWDAMMADPVVRLQYANKFAGSANGWKKWIGMKEAFGKLNVIEREKQKEEDFMKWVGSNRRRESVYGNVLSDIDGIYDKLQTLTEASTLLVETLYNIELISTAGIIDYYTSGHRDNDADFQAEFDKALAGMDKRFRNYDESLDRKEAVAMLDHYRKNVKLDDIILIPGRILSDMDLNEFVDRLFSESRFSSLEKAKGNWTTADFDEDPAVKLYKIINDKYMGLIAEQAGLKEELAKQNKLFTGGLLDWKRGAPSYPDANSTCRLTFGKVSSYSPKDGLVYRHYTTLKGVMQKEDPDNYEFRVPERLKEIYRTKDYGRYADENGEMVTCFLTNLDITGGNSGSPVLDADGCLIGLAFDGNWEAMSGDVIFEPELQRCICVDIRYVLLMMDKFGGAGYLLKEMNIVE